MSAADVHLPEVQQYLAAAPHLKHGELTALYRRLAGEAIAAARTGGRRPRILDLGAGEGTATLALLELGADVVAVDEDAGRLAALQERAAGFPNGLEIHESSAAAVLASSTREYDVVTAVSFLHHVRDVEGIVASAVDALRPGGVFLSFQDPLLHDTTGALSRSFGRAAYLVWRLGAGDLTGGTRRYHRRRRHGLSDVLSEDLEEFHAQRGGVDHRALVSLFRGRGASARLVLYFSTQSSVLQRVGAGLGLENTFALIGGPVG
jgi:SAM-dependent methyltransferase